MGIFTRRRAALAPEWLPENKAMLTLSADVLGDPEATRGTACGVQFWLPGTGASLTIWAYPRCCPEAEGFIVGFRVDRLHVELGDVDADSTFYADYTWGEWFGSAAQAESNAMQAAVLLAAGDRGAALSLYAEPDVIADWFGWDGVPVT
jgi:hypothetical protein